MSAKTSTIVSSSRATIKDDRRPASRRIAILGFGDTLKEAPLDDPSWELVGMNGLWRVIPKPNIAENRFIAWMEIHTQGYLVKHSAASRIGNAQFEWLAKEHPFPIYCIEPCDWIVSGVRFPIEDLITKFGRDYFTSTVAYAIVWAMAQPDVSEIGLWGIDLVHGTEWAEQRPCAEYWLRGAEERGIKVTVPEGSALFKARGRYGYSDPDPFLEEFIHGLVERGNVLGTEIEKQNRINEEAIGKIQTNEGALQMVRELHEQAIAWRRGGRLFKQ